jgi:predicted nuclease of predicted toxin-antitoxin system
LKFLCDSDVDGPLVRRLRDDGHEVAYMTEIQPDSPDEHVLELANSTQAVLITRDKGFGNLVYRQRLVTHGVLLLRLSGVPMSERKDLLSRAAQQHGHELKGAFSVLTRGGLRVRPL